MVNIPRKSKLGESFVCLFEGFYLVIYIMSMSFTQKANLVITFFFDRTFVELIRHIMCSVQFQLGNRGAEQTLL